MWEMSLIMRDGGNRFVGDEWRSATYHPLFDNPSMTLSRSDFLTKETARRVPQLMMREFRRGSRRCQRGRNDSSEGVGERTKRVIYISSLTGTGAELL